MKHIALAGAALLLAAFVDPPAPEPAPTRQWIVGTWYEGLANVEAADCAGAVTIRYEADGTYSRSGEEGFWYLRGDLFSETRAIRRTATGQVVIGPLTMSRIQRIGPDTMLKLGMNGSRVTWRRCPARQ